MPTPGYVFRDGGATPPLDGRTTAVETHPELSRVTPRSVAATHGPLAQKSSESHALATENHDLQGAAQEAGKEARVTNLGWQANAKDVATLVGGLPNEKLWTLIRRFNKVCWMPTCGKVILTIL